MSQSRADPDHPDGSSESDDKDHPSTPHFDILRRESVTMSASSSLKTDSVRLKIFLLLQMLLSPS